jgi:hypothetical protein
MKIIPSLRRHRYVAIVSIILVAVATVVIVTVMVPDGNQDLPLKEIERNLRHPQGEIIELAGPSSLEDCERFQNWAQEFKDKFPLVDGPQVLVGQFVQNFVYSEDLIDDILYRDIDQDGAVRIGVTYQGIIEEFKELGIPITFEIIDLEEVSHLEEAAQEIDEKPYVMGARYDYSAGRIRVTLTKPNWDRYDDIYQEYPDYPLLFRLVDPQPE